MRRMNTALVLAALWAAARAAQAAGEPGLTEQERAGVDRAVQDVLKSTGVPSASLAVVKDGKIAYVQAYGTAKLEPKTPARPEMRYSIGSISKQFTAAAVMMLAEEGKLSLDDPVARFLPDLTRASEVTIRQLLSHTSGYQDYWPQDYVPPFMLKEITAQGILDLWAKKPLDYEPGTQYQYSNTGYVAAGLIVEKASGTPFAEFLGRRIFEPLGMKSVTVMEVSKHAESDPTGCLRYGIGPLRPAPIEGKGWLFSAGELAMTAEDLARWNIAVIERRLLRPSSWEAMETEMRLRNGAGTQYGLGLGVILRSGHRGLTHGGETSGFTASNTIFPDDRAAVSVLTNEDAANASGAISEKVANLLFEPQEAAAEARARKVFEGLRRGTLDRTLFTSNANSYFTEQALRDFAAGFAPLGKILELKQTARRERGGMTFRSFDVKFSKRTLQVWERDLPDGKIEQYQVMARD
jgi:D-alanyl-D-alanine carboxypeptidase